MNQTQQPQAPDPTAAWIDRPWEKRQYAGGSWGLVHWDPTGEIHHVAVDVHPYTIDLLLAAPIFYEAAMAERQVATHLLEHPECPQYALTGTAAGCKDYILAQTSAQELRERAVAIAEGRLRGPVAPPIPDPRLTPSEPPPPDTRAFQTARIFMVEGGQAGRNALVNTFLRETDAAIEDAPDDDELDAATSEAEREFEESRDPYAGHCSCGAAPGEPHRPGCDELAARQDAAREEGRELTDAERINLAAQSEGIDYNLPTSLEARPATAHERKLIDGTGIIGRPMQVVERGDHRGRLTPAQITQVVEAVRRGSTSGIAVREDDTLTLYSPGGDRQVGIKVLNELEAVQGDHISGVQIKPIDAHAEGRCEHCRSLPGYVHLSGCPKV